MPTTDNYGQSVNIAALTDAPNAQTLAANIVNVVTPRTTMIFASASARAATITSPTEGMVSWIQDVDELDVYVGGSWQPISYGSTAWVDWTPAWSGLSLFGASVSSGRYRKIGKTVDFIASLTWGTGSTLGTGQVGCALPFTASSVPAANNGWQGLGRYNDGLSAWRGMIAFLSPGGTAIILQTQRTSDLAYTTPGNVSLGWGTGASMRFQLRYESV